MANYVLHLNDQEVLMLECALTDKRNELIQRAKDCSANYGSAWWIELQAAKAYGDLLYDIRKGLTETSRPARVD